MTTTSTTRRGNIAIIMGVGIFVILGFGAIVVDIGALHQVEADLEIGCDAAALAGASHIDGTAEGLDRATAAAYGAGTENTIRGVPLTAADLSPTFGVWSTESHTFTESADPEAINAIRVYGEPQSVRTPLAGAAWGLGLYDVDSDSIALRPPPEPSERVDCFLPLAIPTCRADDIEAGGHPWLMPVQLANDSSDSVAWAFPDGVGSAEIRDALEAADAGECPGGGLGVGDSLPMTNGVQTATLHDVEEILRRANDPWDADLWGNKPGADEDSAFSTEEFSSVGVLQGPIAVFDEGLQACGAVKFNQSAPVDRFVWAVLFDVYTGPGEHKGVQIYLDLEHDFDVPGDPGGGEGNVTSRPPGQLVE